MTIQEFGQLIKRKKPSFVNLSDEDAANAVLTKYPQYRSQITTPAKQGRIRETLGDIGQTAKNIGGTVVDTGKRILESSAAYKRGEIGAVRGLSESAGLGLGGASKVIGDVVTGGIKTLLSQQQEEALKGAVGSKIKSALPSLVEADKSIGSPVAKLIDRYKGLDENAKRSVDAVLGVGSFALDFAGLGASKKAATAGTNILRKGAGQAEDVIGAVGKAGIEIGEEVVGGIKKTISPPPSPLKAVGEILQGKTRDIKTGVKALSEIRTEGVKTFKDLSKSIGTKIKDLGEQVTKDLGVDTTFTKLKDLVVTQTTKLGKTVKSNPVETGLAHLKEMYNKIGDKLRATEVDELLSEAKKNGLSKIDVNEIAKVYGSEFGKKAFNKMGDALTSINAQLYENTRKALKAVARSGITGDAAKLADETMSKLISTKKLIDKNVEAVNQLTQKIRERGLFEATGHLISKFSDVLTGGALRGAIGGLLPRGAGYKTLNALDLEKVLQKNLKIIKDAIEAKTDKEIINILKKEVPDTTLPKGKGKIPKLSDDIAKAKAEGKSFDEYIVKQEPKSDEVRLYRGLEQKFDKDFDLAKTDAPTGYSTWTDNPELARQYAGKDGLVYEIDLPKKQKGIDLINQDGDRVLFLNNEKPAGLNGIKGEEYLLYNDHELYNPDLIKEFKTKSQLKNIWDK